MTTLPPNRPNNNNNSNGRAVAKEQPYDGRRRQRQPPTNADGTMDAVGDLQDSPMVVAIFLMGVLSWFFRERCVC